MKSQSFQLLYYVMVSGKRPFEQWLNRQPVETQQHVAARLSRVEMGHLGDSKSVGDGVNELRFGNGIRLYYGFYKGSVIILLIGGDKKSQSDDIEFAKKYWKNFKERS